VAFRSNEAVQKSIADARPTERLVLQALRAHSEVQHLADYSEQYGAFDYEFRYAGGPVRVDVKERRTAIGSEWAAHWPDVPPADLLAVNERCIRGLLWGDEAGYLLVRDHVANTWSVFGPWQLALADKRRFDASEDRGNGPFAKGKVLLDLRSAEARSSTLDIDALLDVVRRTRRQVGQNPGIARAPSLQLTLGLEGETDVLHLLDATQGAVARAIGSGHRVVRGVAGSGKTIILRERARLLSRLFPEHQILVTCFNSSLAAALHRQLPSSNVTVRTVDALLRESCRASPTGPAYKLEGDQDENAAAALAVLDAKPELRRFDHVLVDEAQDLGVVALRFTAALLKPGSDSLLVVADIAQSLYGRRFTWKEAGINAVGRSQVLRQNYRNTQEVLTYAYRFLTGHDPEDDAGADLNDEQVIVPPDAALRRGAPPLLLGAHDPAGEVTAIAKQCRELLDGGAKPGDIAVLYGNRRAAGYDWPAGIRRACRDLEVPVQWATDPKDKRKALADSRWVLLSTIHSAKGLEYPHVILTGFLDDSEPENLDERRRLLYVGMTRATERLYLTASGHHPFLADLERHEG
jgi:hypothetical protein